jgi:hypothetical protein
MLTKQELIQKLLEIKQLCFFIENNETKEIEKIVDELLNKIQNIKLNQLKRLVHNERKKYTIGSTENLLYHTLYEELKNVDPADTKRIDTLYNKFINIQKQLKGGTKNEKANN